MKKASPRGVNSLYTSFSIAKAITSRRLRWAGHLTTMEEVRGALKILTNNPIGKSSERPRRRLMQGIT